MKSQYQGLNIFMNGHLVGELEKTPSAGLRFTYDDSWLTSPLARPLSLSLPLINAPYEGDIVANYFDNLLPDNVEIRARIQSKFQIATSQPFDLLGVIGRECVGAIQILVENKVDFKKQILCEPINDHEIASILSGYKNFPLGMKDNSSEFRISIAGAQEKSAFLFHNNQWNRPVGTTPTTHIFKLPIGYISHRQLDLRDSCENEWLCSKIAEAFGIPVAECEILNFDQVKTLCVSRFDRKLSDDHTWIMRLPQEDICQALGVSPHLKYQADGGPGIKEIMNLLLGSSNPTIDRDMFMRSIVLFWLLAAIDGHAKNFSIFILPEGKYRLTPLYDIMSAYPLMSSLQPQKIKMAMAFKGKNVHYHWYNLQRRHFLDTAKFVNYSPERAAMILDDMLTKVDAVIEKVTAILPQQFPQNISQSIFEGMLAIKRKLSIDGTGENSD